MVNYKSLISKIFLEIKKGNDVLQNCKNLFTVIRECEEHYFDYAHEQNKEFRKLVSKTMRECDKDLIESFFELYKGSLLFDAPYHFDSYLLYLEIDRPPQERFYQPRRKVMKVLVDALQDLTDDKLDELFLSMPPRVGKLLSDDTPVLTTKGWKNHGDLQVGDMVFSPNGEPIPVLGVMPKHHTTHTVTMTDGSKFDCHFRHEWKVYDRRFGKERILETQDLIGHLENGGTNHCRGHRYNFMIPNREPIKGVPVNLKVKPYTLGAWLGDGTNQKPAITGAKEDRPILDRIIADGYEENKTYVHKTTGVVTTTFKDLADGLKGYGMCNWRERTEKYIPTDYLIAPIEDRLQLLAGLLDTDGCLIKKEKRYNFTTADEKLKETFIQLISTFGWRVNVVEKQPKVSSSGIVGKKVYWVISFNPTVEIPCVLERKKLKEFSKQRRIAIKSIEESEHKQGNCITVYGGMYLAGNTMVQTHNTSILMFYVTWLIGRFPEKSNLYSAYSDTITKAFYNGVLEIIKDPVTYKWADVFPNRTIANTNASDETLNIDRKKRYPTLTCRSLYGTLNGACDCNGIEMSDDLIGGIEEALNKDRMKSAWEKVDNNLLPRAKENAKILWCGTRWSMIDPAGLRMELLQNDEKFKNRRFKIINLPALNENDESNFDYDYGVGFSTEYYQQRRASFERNNDLASWLAQYMGEPIEREGTLFTPDDFRYFNGTLPPNEPDRIFMPVDPAFGGGDFVAAPICCQYENDIYVVDVVYSNGDKRVTHPLLVNAIEKYGIQAVQVEANKSTESFKQGIQDMLKEKNIRINLTSKMANNTTSKEQRIFDKAPDIRDYFIFLESGCRSKEYSLFMQNVFSFKMFAKNKHDDAPDSLAMACEMVYQPSRKVEIFRRPF